MADAANKAAVIRAYSDDVECWSVVSDWGRADRIAGLAAPPPETKAACPKSPELTDPFHYDWHAW